ncbi:hypothetical protein ACFORH_39195 [Amycolatopsis roodepoortensis]|uniref:IrrE N-terminal-like domain-containing protein n=1 Tax=Amycolatopsis roodepoortensis TaxID=700274 RepID=A0ABR9LIN3_9PSEU|nr:hypothetical protein [Amycolatopsis roodepoortensis]MBE1580544.1 hypothetical protein [Amycolatopsis roodepoortensis]
MTYRSCAEDSLAVHIPAVGRAVTEESAPAPDRSPAGALGALRLPPMYSLDVLIAAVAEAVGRRVQVRAADLDGALPCGMAVATPDAYIIVYPRTSTVLHRTHIIAHELGHILLKHHDALPGSVKDMVREYAPVLAPHLSPELIIRLLGRTVYDTDHELQAEAFAGLVMDRIGHFADYWEHPRQDPAVNKLRVLFGTAG